jgi:hypothetical protein
MTALCEVDTCTKPAGQGRKCYMHYYRLRYHGTTDDPRKPWPVRFWSHVDKTGDCWIWTGAKDPAGYGRFTPGNGMSGTRFAHRMSWVLATGQDPGLQHVLHRCDNPPCVRPDHLFLGDDKTNHADMATKKRAAWGERHHWAKLSESDVRAIRELLRQGHQQRTIAERFNVHQVTISDIRHRRSWRNLED